MYKPLAHRKNMMSTDFTICFEIVTQKLFNVLAKILSQINKKMICQHFERKW
jgi:hypothetical protein